LGVRREARANRRREETSYTDAKSNQTVYAYHARLRRLQPASAYLYAALHDGADPEFGTFRTAPRGRKPFTFTSFGDQGTPTLGKKFVPPPGVTIPNPPFVNDNLGSPPRATRRSGGAIAAGVSSLQWRSLLRQSRRRPCAHMVGLLANNSRSARNRPWMPSPGNHENELGNGPIGYRAYQTYFSVPAAAGRRT